MKRFYRQILFFISTVVFLAVAPLVILYAMGYRTVATTADPLPVGVVLIETFPRRAEVYVNDQPVGRTPRAIPNVPAGKVHIALEKEGFERWEKSVMVKPGLVTELRVVRLFIAKVTPRVIAPGVENLALSPNRQLIATYFGNKTLRIFDKEGELLLAPVTVRHAPRQMLWAPNNTDVLLQNGDGTLEIFSVATPTAPPRLLRSAQRVTHVAWDPRIASRLLTLTTTGTLRAQNTTSQASAVLVTNVQHFATSARQIYTVGTDNKIRVLNLQGGLSRVLPVTFDSPVMKLLVTPDARVAVILENKNVLLIRDDTLISVATNVSNAAWSPDGRMLLVQPEPTALYVYNEADERATVPLQELQLITRLSRGITQAQWFAGGQHVLYQVDDELKIIEIDTRDHPIEYSVDTTNVGDARATVGEDGESLLYLKRDQGVGNLVITPLLLP